MQSALKPPPLRRSCRPRPPRRPRLRDVFAGYHGLFLSLGLQEERSLGYTKFSGYVDGRKVTVTLGARSRNKYMTPHISRRMFVGLILSMRVETTISTRLLLAPADSNQTWLVRWLQKRQGNTEVTRLPSSYCESSVWASEPAWAGTFLARPAVSELMEPGQGLSGSTLAWGPGLCNLTLAQVPTTMSESTLRSHIESLVAVVRLAEDEPPTKVAYPTWIERQCEQGRMPLVFVCLLAGLVGLLMFAGLLVFGTILFVTAALG